MLKINVFCLDDDPEQIMILEDFFESVSLQVGEEFNLISSHTAFELFEQLRSSDKAQDILLVDYYLDSKQGPANGMEVVREVQKIRPDIPVILSSGMRELALDSKVANLAASGKLFFLNKQELNEQSLMIALRLVLARDFRLLMVDDEQDEIELVRGTLNNSIMNRFRVEGAASREEACKKATENRFDAILLDYHLVGCTGDQVAHDLTELGCKAPKLLVTGSEKMELDEATIQLISSGELVFVRKKDLESTALVEILLTARQAHALAKAS